MSHIKVSISALGCYEQCPRKYKFQYIERLPQKERPKHLDIGVYVHEVLEFFHQKADGVSNQEDLDKLLKDTAKDRWSNFSTKLDLEDQRKAVSLLKNYLAYVKNTGMPNVLVTEGPFRFNLSPEVTMSGIVDRIDDIGEGKKRILDYKTGKSKYLDRFQLEVYGLYLKQLYPDITEYVGSYVVLPEGPKVMEYTIKVEELEATKQDVINQAHEIMNDTTWAPKPTKLCDWCEYKDLCPDAFGKDPKVEELIRLGKRTTF